VLMKSASTNVFASYLDGVMDGVICAGLGALKVDFEVDDGTLCFESSKSVARDVDGEKRKAFESTRSP